MTSSGQNHGARAPEWNWLLIEGFNDGPPSESSLSTDEIRTVVREALQNSVDEIDTDRFRNRATRVRIGVRNLTGTDKRDFVRAARLNDLVRHIEAPTIGGLEKGSLDVDLDNLSTPLSVFRYEDSRTRGLKGDQFNPRSNFYNLMKSSGETHKVGGGGSHGKGKSVWSRSSELQAFLIHSITEDRESRVFGLCRTDSHELDGAQYRGVGMYSVPIKHGARTDLSFIDGDSIGDAFLKSLLLDKVLREPDGTTPAGTVFVVPAFTSGTSRPGEDDLNREIIRVVGEEYWPAIVLGKVVVEVESGSGQYVVVDPSDLSQDHDPRIVAMADACRETMAGRVQLSELKDSKQDLLAGRYQLSLLIPQTSSKIDLDLTKSIKRDFPGGSYETAFVLARDPRVSGRHGMIAMFRENGQVVERPSGVPEGVIGFVALGPAARLIAPDVPEPDSAVAAFGNAMIRLMEGPSHDKWELRRRHPRFDQFFPRKETRTAAARSFDRLRTEAVRIARQFAGLWDDDVNEMVRELTSYPFPGDQPPPPPEKKIVVRVQSVEYDANHNATISFFIANLTSATREVQLGVSAESDPPDPLPLLRSSVKATFLDSDTRRTKSPSSPVCSFSGDTDVRVSVPPKRELLLQVKIANDLSSIPVDLKLTRLKPFVRDLS